MSMIKTGIIQDNITDYYNCTAYPSGHVRGAFRRNNCFYRSFSMLRCYTGGDVTLKLKTECIKDRLVVVNEEGSYEYD